MTGRTPRRSGGLPRSFWALWSLYLASRATTFVIPFLGVYLVSVRGLDVGTVGLALGLVGAGGIVANLVGGRSVDAHGGRITFAAGMFATAGAIVVLRWAAGVPMTLVAVALLGFAAELFRPAAAAMVADLVGPVDRAWAFGILFWAVNLGYGISAALGGVLSQTSFDLLFAVDVVACVVVGGLGLRWLPARPAGTAREHAPSGTGPWRHRAFVAYLASWLLYGLVFAQLTTTFPVAMKLAHLDNGTVGLVLALNSFGIVVAQPIVLQLTRRASPVRVVVAGAVVTAGGALSLTAGRGAAVFALGMAVWTVGEILVSAVNQTLIAEFAADRTGAYFGAYGVVWGVAFTVGPLLGSRLLDASPVALWTCCALLAGLAAVGLAVTGGEAVADPARPARSASSRGR